MSKQGYFGFWEGLIVLILIFLAENELIGPLIAIYLLYLLIRFLIALYLKKLDARHEKQKATSKVWHEKGCSVLDLDDKITYFTKAIKLYPKDREYYIDRGNVYRLKEDYSLAISDLKKEMRIDKKRNGFVYYSNSYQLALLYYHSQYYNEAIKELNKIIREIKYPGKDDSKYFKCRGNAYHSKGRFDRAMVDYDKAIEINPDDLEVFELRLFALKKVKFFETKE